MEKRFKMRYMQLFRLMVPILVAALGVACASQQAYYDYDQSVDFAKLRRWSWLPNAQEKPSDDPRIDNDLTRQRIEAAVTRNLEAKGYEKTSQTEADFRVGYLVTVEKKLSSSGVSTSFGFGRYSGGSGVGITVGGPSTPVREYDEGTLFIDIKNPESSDLLWRGSSTNSLGQAETPEQSKQIIDRIVDEILANFPPGKSD